jgi:hypothetical protein
MTDQEKRAREVARRVFKGTMRSRSKDGSRQFLRPYLQVQDVERLVAMAQEGDPDALEVLREHARGARKAGMKVPDDFHTFVWEYFIDGPPKAPPGPKPQDNLLRDIIIVSLAKIINEEFGLQLYRNKDRHDSEDSPLSACAAVSLEFHLGESSVEEICRRGKAGAGR